MMDKLNSHLEPAIRRLFYLLGLLWHRAYYRICECGKIHIVSTRI